MGDILEELETKYGLNFISGDFEDTETRFEGREFIASVEGYDFRTYRKNGRGVVVYSSGEDSGYAEGSSHVLKDLEIFLMKETTGLSPEALEPHWEI